MSLAQRWLTRLGRAALRVHELGPMDAARWALVRAEGLAWNQFFGVETSGGPPPEPPHPESVRYEPLPWQLVRTSLDGLALTRDDVFLDYGAGLGRALLMAARRGPKRVVGVELLEPLAATARRNIRASGRWLKAPVEIHTADAASWRVPDDVTAVYFFNPFVGGVMAAAQERLRESLVRQPRPLRVLYARVLAEPNLFEGLGWLRLEARLDAGVFRDLALEVYETR